LKETCFQDLLLGDPSKAKQQLGWVPRVAFHELVQEMVRADLALMKSDPQA
jgi:GDPmannose 4,6-dehydratase